MIPLFLLFLGIGEHSLHAATAPKIETLIKPEVLRRVIDEREVMSHASLSETSVPGVKRYEFYSTAMAFASVQKTREAMNQYQMMAKILPYVDRSDYDPKTRILQLEGGIWNFKIRSSVRFTPESDRWTRFEIIQGHFKGLSGDIFWEPHGERATLVHIQGHQEAREFPPKFVIERGAEIVFGVTGKRMRSYIETSEGSPQEQRPHDPDIPQPRKHL